MCSVHKVMDEMCRLDEKVVEPDGAFCIVLLRPATGDSPELPWDDQFPEAAAAFHHRGLQLIRAFCDLGACAR
jgi:hypothetical protein